MKKYLLMALTALIAVSSNAQPFTKVGGKQSKVHLFANKHQSKSEVNSFAEFKKSPGKLVLADGKLKTKMATTELRNMKATNAQSVVSAIRRAAQVQETYNGTGSDYLDDGKSVTWTMSSASVEGKNYLVDVIPNPFKSIENVLVEYTINGNEVIVEPQKIAEGNGNYIYIFSWDSDDWAIHMQLGEDGSLTTSPSEDISYGAFTEDAFPGENIASTKNGGTYAGSFQDIEKVKYFLPGEAPAASYEPVGLYLHAHYSPSFYGYQVNYSLIPAAAPVSFIGSATGFVQNWDWSLASADDETKVFTGTEQDFTFTSEPGAAYTPAKLVVSNADGTSAPYQWGLMGTDDEGAPNYTNAYLFAGETASSFMMSDGTTSIITKCNPDFSIAYYGFLGTPDVNTSNYSLSHLILYQGKPSAPLYIEGVNYLVRGFVAKEGFNLKCKIQKATRSASGALTLGEVIAESDINIDDIYVTDEASGIVQLNWKNFYAEDEMGMSTELPYLFIEDEFAVVIEGWDNGTFTANPYGENDYNENGVTSTFIMQTGDSHVYRFSSLYSHQLVGFNNATYGYLYTEDDTNLTVPAEGGETKIHVEPMLNSVDEADKAITRLWLDENVEDNVIPDWLTVQYTDPVQTGSADDGTPIYDTSFDLIFTAEALPAAESGRSATIVFMQEGAQLKVTVTQGEVTGIAAAKAGVKAGNAQMFNLAGQRVSNSYKGLVIKNGKKMLNK